MTWDILLMYRIKITINYNNIYLSMIFAQQQWYSSKIHRQNIKVCPVDNKQNISS